MLQLVFVAVRPAAFVAMSVDIKPDSCPRKCHVVCSFGYVCRKLRSEELECVDLVRTIRGFYDRYFKKKREYTTYFVEAMAFVLQRLPEASEFACRLGAKEVRRLPE